MLVLLASCSSESPPRWQHLAAAHDPARNERVEADARSNLVTDGDSFLWTPPSTAFTPVPGFPGVFQAQRPVLPEGVGADGAADSLTVGGRAWSTFDGAALLGAADPLAHLAELRATLAGGAYHGAGDKLFLLAEEGAALDGVAYRTHLDRGKARDGRWHVPVGRFGGQGLSLLPGERTTLALEGDAPGTLRFALVVHGARGGDVELTATQGAAVLTTETVVPSHPPALRRVTLDVDPTAGPLILTVRGTPANVALLNPVVGPRDAGDYRKRPWGEDRPDLVVFLADTFRADNLATYGGAGLETPNLDRSLADALIFERSWAPSSWTLPSHASLFTGLFPYQHGAVSHTIALGEDAVTLAEHLAKAGYRTGAITDAGYVTREAGLDQGFEWFDQDWGDLDEALGQARAFLDADDGRPVFLFFQTYRAHTPYEPDPRQRDELAARLDLSRPFHDVHAAVFAGGGWNPARDPSVHAPDDLARFRDLYRAAVAALDRGWGTFERDLRQRGLFDTGTVLVTSDHGEAFWEHGLLGHGNGVFEEHLRIPLAFLGRGVPTERRAHAASLVDVPRTLAARAGLEPHPSWLGRDLVTLAVDAPTHAWECNHRDESSSRLRVEGGRKWIFAQEDGSLEAAYDLARDPDERVDASGEAWAAEGRAAALEELDLLQTPLVGPGRSVFGPEAQARLRELGYLGGD